MVFNKIKFNLQIKQCFFLFPIPGVFYDNEAVYIMSDMGDEIINKVKK
jgi:hypothetical protein